MSPILERVLSEIKELTLQELLTLQRQIIDEVQTKAVPVETESSQSKTPAEQLDWQTASAEEIITNLRPEPGFKPLPGAHRPTSQEIEAHLAAVFTPQQRVEMAKVDISKIKLPPGAKTSAQLISEDREDRF